MYSCRLQPEQCDNAVTLTGLVQRSAVGTSVSLDCAVVKLQTALLTLGNNNSLVGSDFPGPRLFTLYPSSLASHASKYIGSGSSFPAIAMAPPMAHTSPMAHFPESNILSLKFSNRT